MFSHQQIFTEIFLVNNIVIIYNQQYKQKLNTLKVNLFKTYNIKILKNS